MVVAPDQLLLLGPEVSDLEVRRRARTSQLTMQELARWARARLPAISRVTGVSRHSETFVLLQAVKMSEEVGELQAEVLGKLKMQRANKSREFDNASLAAEIADVMMTVAVLSVALDIDLPQAMREKMDAVERKLGEASTRRAR